MTTNSHFPPLADRAAAALKQQTNTVVERWDVIDGSVRSEMTLSTTSAHLRPHDRCLSLLHPSRVCVSVSACV